MVYPALLPLLPLMRTPRLPVVEWTDPPADLNGLVRFAERRNLVSTYVPSHLKRSLMLDTPCTEIVWRVLATHSIRQFPLYLPSRASPCAITFQLDSTTMLKPSCLLLRRAYWRRGAVTTIVGTFVSMCKTEHADSTFLGKEWHKKVGVALWARSYGIAQ